MPRGTSDFNALWAGQTVSVVGSALTLFALPTLAIVRLHATPAQVGVLEALQTLPFPILGIVVGVVADRAPRRTIMIAADLARFAILASVPIVAYFGALHLAQLYAVALATGVCSVFFEITYQSYVPVVVTRDDLPRANAKLETSNSGGRMAGTALAGILVQAIGAATSIAFDAASYLVSVLSLARIRAPEPAHDGPALSIPAASREIVEGIRTVLATANLRWIAAATATSNLASAMIGAVALVYAYRVLHLQPGWLGIVTGVAEIGFIGALLSTRIRDRFGLRTTLLGAMIVAGLGNAVMLAAQVGFPYVALFFAAAIAAIAIPIYNINQVSYRQAIVEMRLQGRVNATMRTFVWGTLPLGSLVGGALATDIGVPRTLAVAILIYVLAALWLLPVRERA